MVAVAVQTSSEVTLDKYPSFSGHVHGSVLGEH